MIAVLPRRRRQYLPMCSSRKLLGLLTACETDSTCGASARRNPVLIDGKRLPFGVCSLIANVDMAPARLVERVDVVTPVHQRFMAQTPLPVL